MSHERVLDEHGGGWDGVHVCLGFVVLGGIACVSASWARASRGEDVTDEELRNLVGIAMGPYPSFHERDPRPIFASWKFVLGAIAIEPALIALQRVMSRPSKFPPSPGTVLAEMFPEQLTWPEAFNGIMQVIEMGKKPWHIAQLPEAARVIAERFDWQLTRDGGDQARFRDAYQKEVASGNTSRNLLELGSGGMEEQDLRLIGKPRVGGQVGEGGR